MKHNSYELRILVNKNQKPIQEYEHKGVTFVEGRKGTEFEVEFKNNSTGRVLVIPSVDGVSTLDGQSATPDSKGYVVKPLQTLIIPGWTVDSVAAAKFMFQDRDKSYASGDLRLTTSGVIGVLVYGEEVKVETKVVTREIHHHHQYSPTMPVLPGPLWPNGPYNGYPPNLTGAAQVPYGGWVQTSTSGDPIHTINQLSTRGIAASTASATKGLGNTVEVSADASFELGTGWGQKVDFKINETTFNKGALAAQLAIYYDTRRNLEKRGIEVVKRERTYLSDLPSPFQGVGCKPPAGWKG